MGIGGSEFYAGEVVTSLIGFTNKGSAVFIVTGIEASFRYPQDFSYHIQNVRVSICVCSHVGHPCVWGGHPCDYYSAPDGKGHMWQQNWLQH